MKRVLVLSLIALSVVASTQDTGLLLGLSDREGNSSTVWIGQQGVATFARRAGEGYWLWKDSGFMHIVPEVFSSSEGRSTVTVTDLDGTVRVIKGEEGRPDTDFHIMYVALRGIGLLRMMSVAAPQDNSGGFGGGGSAGGFGGQAFGSSRRSLPRSFRHHDWADLETAVDIDQVFDERVVDKFNEAASRSVISNGPEGVIYGGEASPSNWTLRRDRGTWSLTGLVYDSSQRRFGGIGDQEFTVQGVTHKELGSFEVKGPRWSRIVSEYPDAIDFTVSPDGKLTVIVTPTDVFVHKSSGSSLQKRLQRVRVPADRIVMTQWIGDSEVRKVGVAVSKIKR